MTSKDENLVLAKLLGKKTYKGSPCKKCNQNIRYSSNRDCVSCASKRNKKWMKTNIVDRKKYEKEYKLKNMDKIKQWSLSEKGISCRKKITKKSIAKGKSSWITMMGRMRKWGRIVKWDEELNDFACREAHELARMRDRTTGIKWSVDHIVPLKGKKVTGLHTWNNLQVIPLQSNREKHAYFEV